MSWMRHWGKKSIGPRGRDSFQVKRWARHYQKKPKEGYNKLKADIGASMAFFSVICVNRDFALVWLRDEKGASPRYAPEWSHVRIHCLASLHRAKDIGINWWMLGRWTTLGGSRQVGKENGDSASTLPCQLRNHAQGRVKPTKYFAVEIQIKRSLATARWKCLLSCCQHV